ncbi:MAG: GNAT family N-acetyltransferase [Lachnospiraceae bacterium]|nr:GNAT family N-acetyltransferase [Lachnospiraceae bacterium]
MEKYGLKLYEQQENVINTDILKDDEITFSVLKRIVNANSAKVFTDGKRIVICHSHPLFPVWIWTVEDITQEEIKRVAQCLCEEFPLSGGFRYNISYELMDKLKFIDERLREYEIETNLLSFKCDRINDIQKKCDGRYRLAVQDDMEVLWKYMYNFGLEAEGREFPEEHCRRSIQEKLDVKALYVWENEEGQIVATTSKRFDDAYTGISLVYTVPDARRKGYALNLVHTLTKEILDDGKTAILYTDADYVASNSCYKKIGYKEVGSMCTVKERIR